MSRMINKRTVRALLGAGLVLSLSLFGTAQAAYQGDYDEEHSGVVERINLATNTAVIGGLLYYMAPQLQVEISNSYGAFSMLRKGMFVRVYFVEPRDDDRRAVFIEQLTNPAEWEES